MCRRPGQRQDALDQSALAVINEENMARREFSTAVAEAALIQCRRHCCVCDRWCGAKMIIHHIEGHEDNTDENALPVCFDCHAEIVSYNETHPLGRKFNASELRRVREITYAKYSPPANPSPSGANEYGRGFYDGVTWEQNRATTAEIWRFLSSYGDFAIEILIMFGAKNTASMTNETMMLENIETGTMVTQHQGHCGAWCAGKIAGFWNVDVDQEVLFLTKKGMLFRDYVHAQPELLTQYNQLDVFWREVSSEYRSRDKFIKPSGRRELDLPAGITNALSGEIGSIIRCDNIPEKKFILREVHPTWIELTNIDNGDVMRIEAGNIQDSRKDHQSGEMILSIVT
jgi:hypothetical protein